MFGLAVDEGRHQPEFELIDTGVFDDSGYFDVFVEYAKAEVEDMLVRITVHKRGPETARIHVLPTVWFRNTLREAQTTNEALHRRTPGE